MTCPAAGEHSQQSGANDHPQPCADLDRRAFTGSAIGMCLVRPDGSLASVNRVLCDMLGYSEPELLAIGLLGVTHPEDVAACGERLQSLADGETEVARFTVRCTRRGGSSVSADVTMSVVRQSGGEPPLISAHFLEVSERPSHEEQSSANVDAARDALDAMGDVAMVLSKDLTILSAGPALAERLGKPLPSLIGTPLASHLPPEIAVGRGSHLAEVLRLRQAVHFEDHYDGRTFSNSIHPVLDSQGQVPRLVVFCRDITEQREAEREARERVQVLDAVLAASPVGISLVRDRVPVWSNNAMVAMCGQSLEEHLHMAPRSLYADEAEYRRVGQVLYEGLSHSDTRQTYTSWVRGDGSTIQVHVQARPLDREDLSQGYIVTASDVTEHRRHEKELRASAEQYRGLYEVMAGGVLVLDAEGRFVSANDAACEILGLSREQILDRPPHNPLWDAVQEDGSPFPADRRPASVALRTGRPVHNVVMGLYASDPARRRWLLCNSGPLFEAETGRVRAAVVTFVDITDRKRAEAALRESGERFRAAFEHAGVGMCLTAPDGAFLEVNPALCEMLGYAEEELTSRDFASVTHPEDVGMSRECVRCLLAGERSVDRFEKRYLHKDGGIVWADVCTVLLRDISGDPRYFVTQIQDITDRKRAERDLLEAERRFREMTDLLPDMVFELDHHLQVTYVNRAVHELLGYTQSDLDAGINARDVLDETTLVRASEGLATTVDTGQSAVGVYGVRCRNGNVLPLEVHAMALLQSEGQVVGYRGVMRDVSERQQAEHAHRLAAVGQLSAGVAHEFNNLLAGLLLAAELAGDDQSAEWHDELVKTALAVAFSGSEICSRLMAFARPAAPRREPLQVETVINAALALTAHQMRGAEVAVTRDYDTHETYVRADAKQLEQVFVEMFLNACHAMPEGGELTIETRHVQEGSGAGHVVVSITDTGTGITREYLPRIFEPFFTTKGRLGGSGPVGSGLGLSVLHGIVKAHDGRIDVRSEVGVGTTFELTLHGCDTPAPRQAQDAEAIRVTSASAVPRTDRILVADDVEPIAAFLRRVLAGMGYAVDCVRTTQEAITALQAERYGLVITDLVMPGGGGREVIAAAMALAASPPVLVITGGLDAQTDREVLAMGARRIIRKPFTSAELVRSVDELLTRKQG